MSSVDTSPVNLVKTDNQRLSVRAEIFVTKGWQAMTTYEEALKKARVCWDEVNYCTDQTDAFVFSKKDDISIGGNGPIAVLKKIGECINYVTFLDGGYNTAIVSEKYI